MPVPVRLTVVVAAPLPPFTVSVDDFAPAEVGRNATLIEQVAPTATDAGQLLVSENWPDGTLMLVIGSAKYPVLVSVTVCGVLATESGWFPKVSWLGRSE
jgi:hypothetical protein